MNKVTIILFFLLAVIKVQAQEIKELTLKDAINYALENKSDAKKAQLEIENSNYKISEVRSRALPEIAAIGGLTYNPILQTNVIDGSAFGGPPGTIIEAAFGQKWSSNAGITLNQTLFDQSVFIGLKAAKSTKEFYQLNKELTDDQIIERVAQSYIQIFITKQSLKTIAINLENTEKTKNIIKGLFESGLARKIDLDRMVVRIANINTQKQNIENAIVLQENALKFYMGMPLNTTLELSELDMSIEPQDILADIDVTKRNEFSLLKKQEELLTYQLASIKSAYYPTLSLSGSYNFLGQGAEMPWFKKPADGVYWSDFASIGLNLRIPIFSGFGTKARVNQSNNSIGQLKVDIENTKLALELDGKNAKKQIENSLITIKTQEKNKQLAEEILNNTKNNYKQGLASLTEVIDSENALYEAQNNYTVALLNYKLAEIQLLKSKGELNTLK